MDIAEAGKVLNEYLSEETENYPMYDCVEAGKHDSDTYIAWWLTTEGCGDVRHEWIVKVHQALYMLAPEQRG